MFCLRAVDSNRRASNLKIGVFQKCSTPFNPYFGHLEPGDFLKPLTNVVGRTFAHSLSISNFLSDRKWLRYGPRRGALRARPGGPGGSRFGPPRTLTFQHPKTRFTLISPSLETRRAPPQPLTPFTAPQIQDGGAQGPKCHFEQTRFKRPIFTGKISTTMFSECLS